MRRGDIGDFSRQQQVTSMDIIHKWLLDNRISEVEVLVPDMTGNARGKFIPADKFIRQDNPRLPEGILSLLPRSKAGDKPAATQGSLGAALAEALKRR